MTFSSEMRKAGSHGRRSGNGNGEVILTPGPHDVLLGRGGATNNYCGNIKFRKLVNEHKMRYLACSKVEKPSVAREVVALWKKLNPPGRFLAKIDTAKDKEATLTIPPSTENSTGAPRALWVEVGDKKAQEKASQCLRERTPDVLPFVKQLKERQETERKILVSSTGRPPAVVTPDRDITELHTIHTKRPAEPPLKDRAGEPIASPINAKRARSSSRPDTPRSLGFNAMPHTHANIHGSRHEAIAQSRMMSRRNTVPELPHQHPFVDRRASLPHGPGGPPIPPFAQAQAYAHAQAHARFQAQAHAMAHSKAMAQAQAETQVKAKAYAEEQARAQTEAKARAEAKAEAQAKAEAKERAEAKARAEAKERAKAKSRAEVKLRAETKTRAEAQAQQGAIPRQIDTPAGVASPFTSSPATMMQLHAIGRSANVQQQANSRPANVEVAALHGTGANPYVDLYEPSVHAVHYQQQQLRLQQLQLEQQQLQQQLERQLQMEMEMTRPPMCPTVPTLLAYREHPAADPAALGDPLARELHQHQQRLQQDSAAFIMDPLEREMHQQRLHQGRQQLQQQEDEEQQQQQQSRGVEAPGYLPPSRDDTEPLLLHSPGRNSETSSVNRQRSDPPPTDAFDRPEREQQGQTNGRVGATGGALVESPCRDSPDDPHGEVTLAEYRRTLDAYVENNNITISGQIYSDEDNDNCGGEADLSVRSFGEWNDESKPIGELDSRNESPRPDPPARDMAPSARAPPRIRRVRRNQSGHSLLSTNTARSSITSLSGMSLLSAGGSGASGGAAVNVGSIEEAAAADTKVASGKNFSSGESIVSEITVISHSIDILGLEEEGV